MTTYRVVDEFAVVVAFGQYKSFKNDELRQLATCTFISGALACWFNLKSREKKTDDCDPRIGWMGWLLQIPFIDRVPVSCNSDQCART